ncbi:ureidoacrylate peracid hydrolase [Devosia lucknowensis]|uniref:Ureidoacrylate peracid hydrolase n=1 Tax=Devosia lucknowensis TaxID=1096929 RepID=A0A1Y6GAJ7_9HYPH|nr:isochorismatase family cysteine hydrolase [Devosia lucknowensis]SMQ85457.1 ureidoacrylate peracid hydrolase [Devosia lucknowensis]
MAELHPYRLYDGDIPKQNTALLVVDMQRAFFDNNDSLGQIGIDVSPLRAAIPGTVKLVDIARRNGVPVIFTRYVYSVGGVDFGVKYGAMAEERLAVSSLAHGSDEIELIPELGQRPDEVVIDKSRPSSFYGTRLEPVLTGMGIRNLIVCGVTANICVESTVRDAGQRDYNTFVVADAVAEFLPERTHYALFSMAWSFAHVVQVGDIAKAWGAPNQALAS